MYTRGRLASAATIEMYSGPRETSVSEWHDLRAIWEEAVEKLLHVT